MGQDITEFEYEKFRRIARFMAEIPDGDNRVPKSCADCECYQPTWKYRKCLYTRCKYNKNVDPFRKRPLSEDVILDYFTKLEDLHEIAKTVFGW